MYVCFLWVGFTYLWALILSTVLGVLFNFQTIGRIVFQSHEQRLIFRFFGVYLVVFLFNWLLIKLGLMVGMNAYLSGAVAVIPAAAMSFLLNKFFVFNR
jgi:putative flippase GtrA